MNRKHSVLQALAVVCAFLLALGTAAAASPDKKDKSAGRLLHGKVLDQGDNPLPDAVVYLTNTRNQAVKTYIVGQDGTYRFPALNAATDYSLYAQYKGRKSDTKAVSQFDDRTDVYIDLRVNTQ